MLPSHQTNVTHSIIIIGCRLPSVNFPLMITSFPVLDVYPAGQTVTLGCAAGFTLSGSATATCFETTFMFDDLTASCFPSQLYISIRQILCCFFDVLIC